MRTLKLQMTVSLEGKWDKGMSDFSIENLESVDCILHGRNTGIEFIPYWEKEANNPNEPDYMLGKRFSEIPNFIFSNTITKNALNNTTIIHGDFIAAIQNLKNKNGKDIMVYGGETFVSSLIQFGFIDAYYILINPAAIGNGKQSFNPLFNNVKLNFESSQAFNCGAVLLHYLKKSN